MTYNVFSGTLNPTQYPILPKQNKKAQSTLTPAAKENKYN